MEVFWIVSTAITSFAIGARTGIKWTCELFKNLKEQSQ